MKNKFFLFLLFSLFFFPYNIFALDFTVNETTYTVDSPELLRDYCYYKHIKDTSYNLLIVYKINDTVFDYTAYGCSPIFPPIPQYYNNNIMPENYKSYNLEVPEDFVLNNNAAQLVETPFNNFYSPGSITILYSNFDLSDNNDNITFSSNFTFNDIINKYNPSVEPEPEEPEPEPDVSIPINKEEFYLLLVLLSLLIWLLYFKWCFPFTRGRDL